MKCPLSPLLCCLLLSASAVSASGQAADEGSTGSAIAGAALGAYGGAFTGGLAGEVACAEALLTSPCSTGIMIGGAALGMGTGVWLGATDSDRITSAARGAGIGALAGALVVTGLKETGIRQTDYGPVWVEGVLVGAAVGTLAGALLGGEEESLEADSPAAIIRWSFRLPTR